MKNKTLQRVLCFCLALCFCFSIAIEPIQAHAVAVELGWVTWALVSYLAASGFAFAVTGGIQALQAEVEQQVDEYYTVTGIDLFQLIAQSLKMRPPNGGGLGNGFWFGAAAVAAIADFIQWIRESLNTGNNSVPNVRYVELNASDEIRFPYVVREQVPNGKYYEIVSVGNLVPAADPNVYPYGQENHLYIRGTDNYIIGDISWTNKNGNFNVTMKTYDFEGNQLSSQYFTTGDYYLGFCVVVENAPSSNLVGIARVHPDGRIHRSTYSPKWFTIGEYGVFLNDYTSTADIINPSEVTEFDVQEDQYVEIDFSVFENETTFEEPEQLAEAIKQQIIDTGTTPQIITQVVTETIPQPTPVPTPAPTPVVPLPENPTYDDIDGLGLPSLGDALLDKFPFCLPSDIGRLIDIFKVERQTPVWEVDLYGMLGDRIPFAGDTALSIDLTEYEELGAISRWVTTIGFCLFLLLITRQMITW